MQSKYPILSSREGLSPVVLNIYEYTARHKYLAVSFSAQARATGEEYDSSERSQPSRSQLLRRNLHFFLELLKPSSDKLQQRPESLLSEWAVSPSH